MTTHLAPRDGSAIMPCCGVTPFAVPRADRLTNTPEEVDCARVYVVAALETCQFSWGGLFDSRPASREIHLVRAARTGTPGPTLCGIDRFGPDTPGFSMGGGISDPSAIACPACVKVADLDYPLQPVRGSMWAGLFARDLARDVRVLSGPLWISRP